MKKILLSVCLGLTLVSCGPKAAPNVSPHGVAVLQSDKYVTALSDFQDGIWLAYHQDWLNKEFTNYVAITLESTFVAIYESPNGAKQAALAAIVNIRIRFSQHPEFQRLVPYLNSVQQVVEAL
jgi:hypothetical protein